MIKKTTFVALLLILAFVAACSTTAVTGTWRDDNYAGGPVKKVLVVGMFNNDVVRRTSEDEFVARLREKGVEGVASYRIFPLNPGTPAEEIGAKIKNSDFESMLISRVVDKKQVQEIYPGGVYSPYGYSRRWDNYYDSCLEYIYSPGYRSPIIVMDNPDHAAKRQIYMIETNLYSVRDQALVLSILSDSYSGLSYEALVKDFVKTVLGKLSENKLLAN
ncbi:MAG: hypothetical protein HY885_09310 [Deltaproteobacteria bacterium]|nr:hypothetical protein [Deltaproteobacteria bacterium]